MIMRNQARKFGCEIKGNILIQSLNLESNLKEVVLSDGSVYTSDALILSPGGRSRTLGVPGENLLKGKGISYCATCDGDFFTDKEIMVVGGGNSALEEAVSLTKYASKVTIVHQFNHFQAFEYAIEEARSNSKINFLMESSITAFHGSEKLEGVEITDLKTGIRKNYAVDGTFVFIGYIPNTEFLEGKLKLNNRKEIVVGTEMQTSIPGVFAAGDSIEKRYRQVTTAVADGTIAALEASKYVHELKNTKSLKGV
jgi:thioredoxin reductase (NADPH)